MASTPESVLLNQICPDYDAEAKLKDLLVARARVAAVALLNEDLVARVSITEAACSAAHSLIGGVRSGTVDPSDSKELYRLLLHRTKCKIIDRVRGATAQKRDARRETADDVQEIPREESSPAVEASLNEMSLEYAKLLCEPEDDVYRCINLLGLLSGYKPAEIQQALEAQAWLAPDECPTIPAIRLWLEAERERIQNTLGVDED